MSKEKERLRFHRIQPSCSSPTNYTRFGESS